MRRIAWRLAVLAAVATTGFVVPMGGYASATDGCDEPGYGQIWSGQFGTPLRLAIRLTNTGGIGDGVILCYEVGEPGAEVVGGEAYAGAYATYQWITGAGVYAGNYQDPGTVGAAVHTELSTIIDAWVLDGSKSDMLRVAFFVPYTLPVASGIVWGTGVAVGWLSFVPPGGGTSAAVQFNELCLFANGTQVIGCGNPTAAGVTTTGASPTGTTGEHVATVYLGTTSVPVYGVRV